MSKNALNELLERDDGPHLAPVGLRHAVPVVPLGNVALVEPDAPCPIGVAIDLRGRPVVVGVRERTSSGRDVAVLDGASEEINNTLFRKAHNRLGLSSALIGSGMCFNYDLFRKNVFQLSTAGEDREMEALLLHQEVFIKYAPDIHVFDEKVSNQDNFQKQRMRWMTAQVQSLMSNLPKIPGALVHGKINFVDKTIQQALIPRSILIVLLTAISIFMTIAMPSWCEKWWITLAILGLSLFVAIPKEIRFRSFSKVLTIPALVFRMLKNVLHMDRKNTDFIHTEHTT
jgi:cellulose synthase/poly-beta-1,6-N-acetylglucosamine synthase-like glycosyltransferase